MTEVVDSTAEEVGAEQMAPAPGHDIVPRGGGGGLAVTPSVQAVELSARLSVIRDAMQTAMVSGVDYGRIPGVDKPTLLKPGSEKLGVLFQLDIQLNNEKSWGPGDHLTVDSKATVYHAPTGTRLGFGEGMCTTREKKYAKRKQDRLCPHCGMPAVIKGKQEYGGGWLCFKKKDGCGAKWDDGDPVIESQETGEVENPDLPDLWNTVLKMAEKRARVDAVLAVTGASALFTQDAEDLGANPPPQEPPPSRPPAKPAPVIDADRAAEIGLLVTEAIQHEVDSKRLALIFSAAGAGAVNREAIANLTVAQADEIDMALTHEIEAKA